MKLAIISPYGTYPEHNSGPPIVIYNLLKYWSSKVEEIHLFTGSREIDTIPSLYKQYKNLHVYIIPRDWDRAKTSIEHVKYVSSFRMILELISRVPIQSYGIINQISEIKPDIVFYNIMPMDSSIAVPFILRLMNACQIARIPVCHPQEFKNISSSFILRWLMKITYKLMLLNMDLIITQSPKVQKEIKNYIHKKVSVFIISNGTELIPHGKSVLQNSEKIRILFTGKISKEKGIETLIDAVINLDRSIVNRIEILLVGPGWQDYIAYISHKIEANHLENIIRIVGEVNHEEIFKYYKKSDIYVFPSFREGMPNSVLEAMGCELPIVASNIDANKNLIKDGENGILFNVGDPRQLGCALERLICDPKLRRIIGENAYNSIKLRSWENISEEYLTALKEAVERKHNKIR
jgi:glycosyltransferase involved in cell wall biosynthesis